jgi:hypothetical protein
MESHLLSTFFIMVELLITGTNFSYQYSILEPFLDNKVSGFHHNVVEAWDVDNTLSG